MAAVTSPLEMPIDAVRRHANSVRQVASSVETAHQAANQVYLDVGAFGQLCSFVPSLFDPVLRSAVEAIADAASSLEDMSDKLRLAADYAEAADEASEAVVQRAGDHRIDLPL